MPIPLGRFLLDDVVGSGGAGIVWRARHEKLELPVAVKVLPPKADRLALHAHKNEVQAVARLHHPHVIALLDAGLVDDTASAWAARAKQDITAGSPWLAIELASGGDLSALRPPFEWPVISDLLRTLLAALAHAHARGVIHKDLKPQNVLLCTVDDVRPGVKLTDFGLALAGDRAERLDGGTPLFMAPEQFDADGRDLGPGTDLYALGCLAHWLATGTPPFIDGSWRMLAARHVEEKPRPLPPSDAPDGLSAWMLRLLEKNPAKRFRCAADADQALAALDPSRPMPPSDRLPEGVVDLLLAAAVAVDPRSVSHDDATVMKAGGVTEIAPFRDDTVVHVAPSSSPSRSQPSSAHASSAHASSAHASSSAQSAQSSSPSSRAPSSSMPNVPRVAVSMGTAWREAERSSASDGRVGSRSADSDSAGFLSGEGPRSTTQTQPPPLDVGAAVPPRSWRAGAPDLVDLRLVEAGLSLWGLRPVPLVGREAERDLLWDALLAVHERRAPRVVVVRGPSGVGKSRVAEWIAHRALETGAALALKATFQPIAGREDGLAGMVARHAQFDRVDAAGEESVAKHHAQAWLERWLHGADLTASELCALAGRKDGVFPSGDERHAALVRLLVARSRERPLIVWLDDVQHGKDALTLVARVIADAPELAALFVITAVDELLDDDARARIADLVAHPSGTQIELSPLEEVAHDELCGRLLGGEAGGLTDELRRRTEGNPLFAVHLVGDWIARGLLEVTDAGLALRAGTSPELPDALHALWASRIESAIAEEGGKQALEVAAVLGSTVDLLEWEAAVREAARTAPALVGIELDDVVDALAGAGLGRRSESGFTFAHSMVRGSVERRAREANRLASHHACAAASLAALWGTDTPTVAARMGRHLLAAGAPLAALAPLLVAARSALGEGDVLEASAVLADWDRACLAVKLPDGDARVGPGLVLRARVAEHEGRHDEARALANRAATVARDNRKRADALCTEASACVALALLDDAAALYDEARVLSGKIDDKLGVGVALRGLGDVAYYRGDREAASARYTAVAALFAEHGKKSDLVASLWSLGYVEMERGAFDDAKRLFHEQRKVSRATRDRLGEANAENALGELARRAGSLDEAEQHYRQAARIASKSGLSRRWTFRLNLAHLRIERGDVANARVLAAELLSSNAAKEPLVAASAWWILACDAAVRADMTTYDRCSNEAIAVGRLGIVENDLATVAQRAGDLVAVHDRGRAQRAWTFANEKWKQLGRT